MMRVFYVLMNFKCVFPWGVGFLFVWGLGADLTVGYGYCGCDDFEKIIRKLVGLWCRLRDHLKVSIVKRSLLQSLNVASCSRHPDDLYKNGIQRSSFVPAIELLKSRFDVTDLDSGTGSFSSLLLFLLTN